MSQVAIKVENLSKIYKLGEIGTGTLSQDIERWIRVNLLKLEDPFANIDTQQGSRKHKNEQVKILEDINFEINKGEAVGIIGKNGAGKSTLLKILSRITSPTTGRIKIYGRLASLLEVGTGFHPELTGRENIFLNGALLGMKKNEIMSKFEEIVEFSGIAKFIDTPVKRYSSGMYVRLAFAVAAHLESEILIVDEVLAVGDAEFQKKCLGKMQDITKGEGRTILFVSHNLAAVENFCEKSIFIEKGKLKMIGETNSIIQQYLTTVSSVGGLKLSELTDRKGNQQLKFLDYWFEQDGIYCETNLEAFVNLKIGIEYEVKDYENIHNLQIDLGINDMYEQRISLLTTTLSNERIPNTNNNKIVFEINQFPIAPGSYNCTLFSTINGEITDWISNIMQFNVLEKDYYKSGKIITNNVSKALLNYTSTQL
jgi:lipopolysaccharide transport system ATP-binding protein